MKTLQQITLILTAFSILVISCGPSQRGLFGKKNPHEAYQARLRDAGLENTQLGRLWFSAADRALTRPVQVSLPYKETGYFEMEKPGVGGYIFSAIRGEKITVTVQTKPANGSLLFVELWEPAGQKPRLLSAADTLARNITHEIEKDGNYIVRLQPELLTGMAYTVSITVGPSLAFPVHKNNDPRVISFWGADRDAGARSHEGIDIQAKKGTPVVAAAEGRVTSVSENNLGGKVVFMRPKGKEVNLYYAHLDEQLVNDGQAVAMGDTLGLMGNTGNAKNTVPHLHFGIYALGGAINPLPFIQNTRTGIRPVKADTGNVRSWVRARSGISLYSEPATTAVLKTNSPASSVMKVLAATDDFYKIELPDGNSWFVKSASVTKEPVKLEKVDSSKLLLDAPVDGAAMKTLIKKGDEISLLGTYGNYYFAKWNQMYGWVKK